MRLHEGDDVIQIQIQDVAAFAVHEFGNGFLQVLHDGLRIAPEKDRYLSKGLTADVDEKE